MEKILSLLNKLPCDKAKHAFYGLFIYNLFSFLNHTLAILIVIALGVSKEVYDRKHKDIHTPDIKDAIATILPSFIIYIIWYFLDVVR